MGKSCCSCTNKDKETESGVFAPAAPDPIPSYMFPENTDRIPKKKKQKKQLTEYQAMKLADYKTKLIGEKGKSDYVGMLKGRRNTD